MVGGEGGIEVVNGGDVVVDAVGLFSDNEGIRKRERKHPQITQNTQIFSENI